MKRIYAFTLDGEDYPSSKFRSNLRLIAYLMYDYIYNYDEGVNALIINKKISYNSVDYRVNLNDFHFEYDTSDEKYCNKEPFFVGNRSFALTIDDEVMSEDIIHQLMNQVLVEVSLLTRVNYDYTIRTIGYLSKNMEDERNRKKAVCQLYDELAENVEKRSGFSRKKVMTSKNILRRVGLF